MRKVISAFLLLGMLAIIPLMPATTMAAPSTAVEFSGESNVMRPCYGGRIYRKRLTRSQRNRRLVNALIGGGIGAAIGGGIGGGRGALIGAGSGAGGYLLYRYIKDRRGRCVPQYIRRG